MLSSQVLLLVYGPYVATHESLTTKVLISTSEVTMTDVPLHVPRSTQGTCDFNSYIDLAWLDFWIDCCMRVTYY